MVFFAVKFTFLATKMPHLASLSVTLIAKKTMMIKFFSKKICTEYVKFLMGIR